MSFKKNTLTVIIPTRERPDTLKHCLRTVSEQKDPRLEIIVSDNVSGPETKEIVDGFSDARIKYIRPDSRLGMSEHWEFALGHATGEWVTFVGDDDGLIPGAVTSFFDLIKDKDVQAVETSLCKFHWPNQALKKDSKLMVQLATGTELRQSKPWLMRAMQAKEKFAVLPYIYTGGFIHADLIAKIKANSAGRFFCSITPDVYSGIAVALTADSYLYSWSPLAIAGLSKHSTGSNMNDWKAQDLKKLHFFSESTIGFHPKLGNGVVQSLPMYMYEAFLRAEHLSPTDMGITIEDQLALTIVYADKARKNDVYLYCKEVAENNHVDFSKVEKKLMGLYLNKRITKITRNILRALFPQGKTKNVKIWGDPSLNNVYDASQKIAEVLNKQAA